MSVPRPLLILLLLVISLGGLATPRTSATPLHEATPRVVEDFAAALRSGYNSDGIPIGWFTAQDGGSTVAFARTDALPAPVPGLPQPNHALKMDFRVAAYGVVIHGFENDALNTWVSQDWSAYGGLAFWVYGGNSGTDLFVDLIDNRNPGSTRDDAERFTVTFKDNFSGWKYLEFPFDSFVRKEIGNGAPNDGLTLTEVHGWAFGALTTTGTQTYYLDQLTLYGTAPVRPLTVGFTRSSYDVVEGHIARVTVKLSKASDSAVTIRYTTAPGSAQAQRDYTPASGTLTFAPGVLQQTFTIATHDDTKYEGDESALLQLDNPGGAELGLPSAARLNIQENDAYDPALLDDFESAPYLFDLRRNVALERREIPAGSTLALPGQDAYEGVLAATSSAPGPSSFSFGRRFALGEDWSAGRGLSFWYYGQNSGRKLKVGLLDNQAADPGPSGWQLAWSDEFNGPAGTPPDPGTWTHEIGDGTVNGIPGWGNSELQYYTDSAENAAMDGDGNLVLSVKETGEQSALRCYYGPCKYTSARLISSDKAEFAYGRVEARIRVPRGAGLWPAFWMLGTDIERVGWPQTGEIDIMEHVGRAPYRVFGTIHGPGYSGGESFGDVYDFAEPVAERYHTYAVEWQPTKIVWYVDGIKYHEADPADVAPDQWVFNHPFFLILNVAVGGNFGGPVGGDTTFPQMMNVDYVRVYQGVDTAERFESSFTDNFSGWRRVVLPFSSFSRSAEQPAGAPDDGLTLTSVWGYTFEVPGGVRAPVLIDQVRVQQACADEIIVSSAADRGAGTLRQALQDVCRRGTIGFVPGLANATIALDSASLTLTRDVTIDGGASPGLTISGGGTLRPLVIDPRVNATIRSLTIADGYGYELSGGILNNGTLTLDHVIVAGNRVTTSGADYWKGGAGIYSGRYSTLRVLDSTIRQNQTQGADGGGLYSFFDTLVTIERSTIAANTSTNVGGGLRSLGDVAILNSTISGNISTGWHGGALFHTDGAMRIAYSTIANNSAPAGTTGGMFVGTFTEGSPSLTLASTIVGGNSGAQCFAGRFGAGAVTLISGGHNLSSDASCALTGTGDRAGVDPQLGALADNGGPTLTHALLSGSPALDAADPAACPPTDQRGTPRPQGAACDIGAFER
ncbi:MAG TPA: family 16 glycosylhydrolase [Herpetosiphonaceae bacterium]